MNRLQKERSQEALVLCGFCVLTLTRKPTTECRTDDEMELLLVGRSGQIFDCVCSTFMRLLPKRSFNQWVRLLVEPNECAKLGVSPIDRGPDEINAADDEMQMERARLTLGDREQVGNWRCFSRLTPW